MTIFDDISRLSISFDFVSIYFNIFGFILQFHTWFFFAVVVVAGMIGNIFPLISLSLSLSLSLLSLVGRDP